MPDPWRKKAVKIVFLSVMTLILVAACGTKNPPLEAPIQTFNATELDANQVQADVNSKVDILVVVDNSLSMDKHQKNLAVNVDKFVNAFAKNATIDYHFGVTTIYDSIKFGTRVTKFNPQGQLVPLKLHGQEVPGPRFVTRDTPNGIDILRETIFMGTEQGPEFEESFSPVPAAISSQLAQGSNAGFYRPDAYLALIFITDADDSSPNLSPEELYSTLLAAKGDRSKIMAMGAIVPIEANTCARDPSGPPYRITKFLTLVSGNILNLCSTDFGGDLAQIAVKMSEQVSRQVVRLPAVPDPTTIEVKFGSQVIPPDIKKGWAYDPRDQSIVIGSGAELKPEPNAKISIRYVPVDISNERNGRTKRIGSQG
jgi:hypothetical protein